MNIIETWKEKFYTINPDKRKQRLDICHTCEHYVNITKQCSQCGCVLPLKVKFGKSSCPKGKWGEEPEGNHPLVEIDKSSFLNN
jgi:hypothetical protein